MRTVSEYNPKVKFFFRSLFLLILITSFTLIVSFSTFLISPISAAILIAPLLLIILWRFPDIPYVPPLARIRLVFLSWLVISILWPYYLVLKLPGGGSIYPVRLFLIFVILYAGFYLLKSQVLRSQFTDYFSTYRLAFTLLLAFLTFQFIGSFFVGTFDGGPYNFTRQIFEIFIPVMFILFLFSDREKILLLFNTLFFVSVIVVLIGLYEAIFSKGFYATVIPSWMISSQEFVQEAIEDKFRNGFRVQSVFGHPLALAQYLILVFPLFIYKFISSSNIFNRLLLLSLIIALFFVIVRTDSRASIVAIFIQSVIFLALTLFFIIKEKKTSFLGWIFITASPIFIALAVFIALSAQDLIVGKTAIEASSASGRIIMLYKTVDIFINQPIQLFTGFGTGLAAINLGYYSGNGNLTIDSYPLSIILESGILGLITFITLFSYIIYLGVRLYVKSDNFRILSLAIILGIAGYLVISITSSRPDNLRLIYIYALSILILTYQTKMIDFKHQQINGEK